MKSLRRCARGPSFQVLVILYISAAVYGKAVQGKAYAGAHAARFNFVVILNIRPPILTRIISPCGGRHLRLNKKRGRVGGGRRGRVPGRVRHYRHVPKRLERKTRFLAGDDVDICLAEYAITDTFLPPYARAQARGAEDYAHILFLFLIAPRNALADGEAGEQITSTLLPPYARAKARGARGTGAYSL